MRRQSILKLTALVAMTAACGGGGGHSSPTENQSFQLAISASLVPSSQLVTSVATSVYLDSTMVGIKVCGVPGCNNVDLSASTSASRGSHSVAFQPGNILCDLMQCGAGGATYTVSGNVIVSNSGGTGAIVQQIPLASQTVALKEGDRVTYTINVNP